MTKIMLFAAGVMLISIVPVAHSQCESISCLDRAYEKARSNYKKGDWLDAYVYFRATLLCLDTSYLLDERERDGFRRKVRNLEADAWDEYTLKLYKKQSKSAKDVEIPTRAPRVR